MTETVDRRILGAFICTDGITGSSVVPAIPASAQQWTIRANHSGVYVIFSGPGFEPQTDDFIPSGSWPASQAFEVTLQDPALRYLPRRASVRAPAPVPVIPPASPALTGIFAPQQVPLYPSPASPFSPNWAILHVSVLRAGASPAQALPWAILQVVRDSDHTVLATGQSGANGEALLAVAGLTLQVNSGGGPVTISKISATVTVWFDPAILSQPDGWIPNPDDILGNLSNPTLKSSSQSIQLSSGQELSMSFSIPI